MRRQIFFALLNSSFVCLDGVDTAFDVLTYCHMFEVLGEIKGVENCKAMNEKSYFSTVLAQQTMTFWNSTTFYPYPPLEWYDAFPRFLELVSEPGWDDYYNIWGYAGFPEKAAANELEFIAGCEAFGDECEFNPSTSTCDENDDYNNRFWRFELVLQLSVAVWVAKEGCKLAIVLYAFVAGRIPKHCTLLCRKSIFTFLLVFRVEDYKANVLYHQPSHREMAAAFVYGECKDMSSSNNTNQTKLN